MRLRPLALGAIVGVCAGSSAIAQQMPNVGNKRQTEIGLRLAVIHDSNISRSSEAVALMRGLQQEDYTYQPQATVSITQPIGRQVIFLRGSGGYDFHQENKRLDRRRIDVTGGGVASLSACKVAATAAYAAGQSELDDLTGFAVKNLQKTTTEGVNVACGQQRGFATLISGQHQDVTNSSIRQESTDHSSDTGTAAVSYVNPALGNLSVIFNYSVQDFPNRVNVTGGVGDGYLTRTLGANYDRRFGTKLKMAARAGATMVKRDSAPPGIPLKFTATTYNGSVDYILSRQFQFTATASRAVMPSNRAGKLYDITTDVDAHTRYKLGTRFVLTTGYTRSNTASNTDTALVGAVITKARLNTAYGSVNYRQSNKLSYIIDLRQLDRKTNLPMFDYSDTRFSISAALTF